MRCRHAAMAPRRRLYVDGNCFNVTPPAIATMCSQIHTGNGSRVDCRLSHRSNCNNFPSAAGLPRAVIIAIATSLTIGVCALGCVLFVFRHRIQETWCPKPVKYLNEADAVEYEASKRAYELAEAGAQASLRVHNPIAAGGGKKKRSPTQRSPFARLTKSNRTSPMYPSAVHIPTLRIDDITRPPTSGADRTLTSATSQPSLTALQLQFVSSPASQSQPPTSRASEVQFSVTSPHKITSAPGTARNHCKRTVHFQYLPIVFTTCTC